MEHLTVIDASFEALVGRGASLQALRTGLGFADGPTWVEGLGGLVFSDIRADEMLLWTPGATRTFRRPSGRASGNTVDHLDRLVTCEHAARRVSRTARDGGVSTLADRYDHRRLNSPDDVVVRMDGSVWFTDPPFGIRRDEVEQAGHYVFRMAVPTCELVVVAEDFDHPNGLCFSPDQSRLFVADTPRGHVRVFNVRANNTLDVGEVFCQVAAGGPEGLRADVDGRLYVACGDGVDVFDVDGRLLGTVRTGEPATNCAFGGQGRTTLFITTPGSLYSIEWAVAGAQRP